MKTILWLVLIPFFGFLWSGEPDNDLIKLLEEAKSLEQKRKFKSAAALAIEIQNEAKAQDRDVIFVKAVDIELSANRWFGFETFKDALNRFDEHIGESFGRTEALLRIYKIQGYATYYNQHKRQLADNIHDNILNEDPKLWSKHDIWKLINHEINTILALDGNDNLSEKELKLLGNIDRLDNVVPRKVSDYALLLGIETIATFDGDFILGEDQFYAPVQKFVNYYAKVNDNHPNYLIANYYARLLKNQAKSDELLVNHINLQRLEKLFNKDDRFAKLHLYEKALLPLTKLASPSMSLASARLAQIYNGYAQMYNQKGHTQKAYKWQQNAIRLCETGMKQYPKSYGAKKCKELLTSIKLPNLEVKLSQNVIPGQLVPTRFTARNLVALTIEAYRVSATTYMANFVNKTNLKIDNLEHAWTHAIDVPKQNGYFNQSFIDCLPEFQNGFYYIRITSYRKDKGGDGAETSFYVNASAINSITKPETDATALQLLNAKTGEQLPSAHVELVVREYDYTTREQLFVVKEKVPVSAGIALINRNQRVDYVQVTKGSDTLITHFSSNYVRSRNEQNNKKLKIFTDRQIYRPGQKIHFKGFFASHMANNYKALANEKVTISLVGTNYKVLQEQEVTSNNYGSFHGMFQIPEQIRPGRMLIRTRYGTTGVNIQYYKRPSFDVEWSENTELVLPGTTVKLPLKVQSYMGAPISNAVVKSTISVSSSFFKYWHFFSTEQIVTTHTDSTNNTGETTVVFSSLTNNEAQRYTIKTTVTLPDGASREFVKHYTVAPNPLVVQLSDNSDVLVSGQLPSVNIEGINGENVTSEMSLAINRLETNSDYFYTTVVGTADTILVNEARWKENFPGMAWHHSLDPAKLKVSETVFEYSAPADKLKLPEVELEEGLYEFEFRISDTVNTRFYRKISNLNDNKCQLPTPLTMVTNKSKLSPGETLEIQLSSKFQHGDIHLLISDKQGELLSEMVKIKKRKGELSFNIKQEHEGEIKIDAVLVRNGQLFSEQSTVTVTPISRQIAVEFESIRDKMTPGTNETIVVKLAKKGEHAENAEILASMYDMSLDAFAPFKWNKPFQMQYGSFRSFQGLGFRMINHYTGRNMPPTPDYSPNWTFSMLFNKNTGGTMRPQIMLREGSKTQVKTVSVVDDQNDDKNEVLPPEGQDEGAPDNINVRTNFNETAFFYPNLYSDKNGEAALKFQVPESMSRWKLQVLTHDKQMAFGYAIHEIVTQKPIMVMPNRLRFVHHGDKVTVQAIIYNQSDSVLVVKPYAKVNDPVSGDAIDVKLPNKTISVKGGANASFEFSFVVPETISVLSYQVGGKSGMYSDGEKHMVKVLPARQQIVNSMVVWNKPQQKKDYTFQSVAKLNSSTARNHSLTFELTTNPVWIAIKAMPAVYKSDDKSAVQVARNFHVVAQASSLIQNYPEIKRVFEVWQKAQPEALSSAMKQNNDLRNLLIGETPWETVADNEELQHSVLMEMLNPNFVSRNMEHAVAALQEQQHQSGAFSWRPGMRTSYYFTLRTVWQLSQALDLADVRKSGLQQIIEKALGYLEIQLKQRYDELIQHNADTSIYVTSVDVMQYLLIKRKIDTGVELTTDADQFYYRHTQLYQKMHLNQLTLSGMVAKAYDNEKFANLIIDRLRERAVINADDGMSWRENSSGWNWYEAPIQTQAQIIEFFHGMKQSMDEIESMKLWLIKQKQGQAWNNSEASLSAVRALLGTGKNWVDTKNTVLITIGDLELNSNSSAQEAGSGYFRKNISSLKPNMQNVSVENRGETPVWGAIYHKYSEAFENIKPWQDELSVKRELLSVTKGGTSAHNVPLTGKNELNVGDRIQVRLTIRSNRKLDYVYVVSPHGACFEPVDQLSGYRYSGGLHYYAESRDNEKRYFIDHLEKGTFVIHYDLFVERPGTFNAGAVEIQSAYAPEFGAHSSGYAVTISK